VAAIVDRHPAPDNGKPGYSLEAFNAIGETIGAIVVAESDLQEPHADEVLSVRPLAIAAEEIGADDSLPAVGEGVDHLGTNHVLAAGEDQRAGNLRFQSFMALLMAETKRSALLHPIHLIGGHRLLDRDRLLKGVWNFFRILIMRNHPDKILQIEVQVLVKSPVASQHQKEKLFSLLKIKQCRENDNKVLYIKTRTERQTANQGQLARMKKH
jgi:hypothetical protein